MTHAPEPPATKDVPVFDCGTCADRGEVGLILESLAGPVRKAIPCPDCGGSPLTFAAARDTAIGKLNVEIKAQARVLAMVILALGLTVGVLFVITFKGSKIPLPSIDLKDIGEGVTNG